MENINIDLINCLQNTQKCFEIEVRELLRKEIERCINILLKSELTVFLNYEPYERNKTDDNYRNGSYERELLTSFGKINLSIPRDRLSEFKNKLMPPYKRRTDTFDDMILEIAQSGLSRETTAKVLKGLYGVSYSANTISSIGECFEEEIINFQNHQLDENYFAIYLDGTFLPLRRGEIQKECILIALGIKNDGSKEVLGYKINPTENLESYRELLENLKKRGLKTNGLFISDGFVGLNNLIKELFPKSEFQRCLVHVMRNFNQRVRPNDRREITREFKEIKESSNITDAKNNFEDFVLKWEKKYKSLNLSLLDPNELFCYLKYPKPLQKILCTTNPIESLNKEIKRRTKIRIISSEKTLLQDLTVIFTNYNNKNRKIHNYDLIYSCNTD